MIEGEIWKLHDDGTIRRIDEAAVRLLCKTGLRVEHAHLRGLLASAGCRVDESTNRCYLRENLIRDAIAKVGGKQGTGVRVPAGWSPKLRIRHSGSHPHLLDWPGGERRLATRKDVTDMARMAHVLDEFETVGRVLTCAEVDPRVEPLWTTLQIAKTTNKRIGGGEIFSADYIEPLVRMGEVLSGVPNDASLVAECDFFIAPLILDPKQAECFVEKRKWGCINVPGTMPVSGISAPVTIAGTVVVCVAELLAGWVLGYLVAPELPAGGIVASGSLDMRTMTALFGSPEAQLQNAATVNICRRLYGISVWAATGYVDCKRPGLEAAFMKMSGTVTSAFGTERLPGADGLLSAGQDYSPVQHMLDWELAKLVERVWGHFEVDDETLALDLIDEVARSGSTNFLDTSHTAGNFAREQYYPRWIDRTSWQNTAYETAAEHKMLCRIDRYCKDAIARYAPPELDCAKLRELERIYATAEAKLTR